ncbi:Concanavalin A-like lectin/glucanase domain superfamily [Arabidopsis thaliana x Arabidopsis arenosa]|uniref:Concanavalin A-like lectin/glucanase domain superfamily n=1 Tax=Arabidopsis thaliana x Arabidopsis arenosa TaxID=1240361 RepID=A0A8T1ZKS9_9BRAS|nr:Concanavalin A-like lectin/glucanase domain superfamily [Arabidopsis thaliana x Arabidopsis arenosa]
MARELHLVLMMFCVHLICISSQQETVFIYKGFGETDHGVAKGLLQLTDGSRLKMGHTFFKNPFEFSSTRSLSFTTQFVCALVSKAGFVCGHSAALLVQATIIMYLVLGTVIVYVERKYAKPREEWEKEDDGPRRFTYKSLYMATKGFNKYGLFRKRGFGEVNRGTPIRTRRERRRKERKNRN